MTKEGGARNNDEPIGDDEVDRLFLLFKNCKGVLLAVSGGPDSIALLGLAARWNESQGKKRKFVAATFDHRLRDESTREANDVARFCERLGVEHRILAWRGERPKSGLQAAAREARYAALIDLAIAIDIHRIALAHHRDDQAETILMRLAAGSGIDGLGGMEARTDFRGWGLLRPFLDIPKSRLVATCLAHGWSFADDPSNRDEKFSRARLRSIAPLLAREGLDAIRLSRLGLRARRAQDALERGVDRWLDANRPRFVRGKRQIAAGAWAAEPSEIRLRILSRMIEGVANGVDLSTPERLERLERLEERLSAALNERRPFSQNLRGVLVRADLHDALTFAPEPPRGARNKP